MMAYTNRDPAKGAPTAQQQAGAGEVPETVDRLAEILKAEFDALSKRKSADALEFFAAYAARLECRGVTVAKGGE